MTLAEIDLNEERQHDAAVVGWQNSMTLAGSGLDDLPLALRRTLRRALRQGDDLDAAHWLGRLHGLGVFPRADADLLEEGR